jgi:hypothetical protein
MDTVNTGDRPPIETTETRTIEFNGCCVTREPHGGLALAGNAWQYTVEFDHDEALVLRDVLNRLYPQTTNGYIVSPSHHVYFPSSKED